MPEIAMPGSQSSAAKSDDSFALCPPPTRRRLFIHMLTQPKEFVDATDAGPKEQPTNARSKQLFGEIKSASNGHGKKRQHRESSVTSRNITKKTAHRLVEKRRRNKINETFALLGSLIPACASNVHKHAILQASIDYIRYLENSLAELKAQLSGYDRLDRARRISLPSIGDFHAEPSGNLVMSGSDIASPNIARRLGSVSQPFISPSSEAKDTPNRLLPYSSIYTDQKYHDPSGIGQVLEASSSPNRVPRHKVIIPAWKISPELDHEAAAALLAFSSYQHCPIRNQSLSVHDLLCT